jgi:peptide/nickel transport system permease protein
MALQIADGSKGGPVSTKTILPSPGAPAESAAMTSERADAPQRPRSVVRAARAVYGHLRIISSDPLGLVGLVIVIFFVLVGTFGSHFAPYGPFDYVQLPTGRVARLAPPSWAYPFGTNYIGQDVLSQTIHGTAITLIVGLCSGLLIGIIGTAVGVFSGYYGGWIDGALMRIVDIFMGIPTLPFAILFVALTEPKMSTIVLIFVILFWRTSARAVRSSVLTLKERQYVKAARAAGAGDLRIMWVHIMPNVLPLAFLYVVFGTGSAILAEASLSFLGLGDPTVVTWGQMINLAFKSAAIREAWWWVMPPCFSLIAFLSAVFFIGRAYEEKLNPRLRRGA